MDEKLKEREEFYRTVIEKSLNPVYIIQNGKFVYVNRAFEELTGYSKDELIGKIFFMVHPEDKNEVYSRYLEREEGKRDIETYSFRIVRKDGEVRWLTVKPGRIRLKNDFAVAATGIDTTEIHRLNEELRKRAEYLSLLNSILRHDFANALTTISAALEIQNEAIIAKAKEKINYLAKLLSDLRVLETALEKLKVVNLAEIAEEIAKLYDVELKVEDTFAYANEGLKVVINNIVQNSFVHGGENVKVLIETFKNNNFVGFRISDTGKGIPEEIKAKIFEKGFTTGKRTGIGLFVANWLVKMYNGKIEVKDNKPTGTIFEITLPSA
ncbi:MAG: PAS domain-containing sensor histidine kinase [Archaeoglobaceae archaeon]